jgi:bacteriocin biosynthesis cyclodehydratase domain-containing protein
MKLELSSEKLFAVPVSLVETTDGVILKRGRTAIKVGGEEAARVLGSVLSAARNGASREQLLGRFVPEERETIENLVDHLIGRRILISEGESPEAGRDIESPLDVFYWQFETQTAQVRERLNARRIKIFGVNYISLRLAAGLRASGADSFEIVDVPLLRNAALFGPGGEPNESIGSVVAFDERMDPDSLDCLVVTSDAGGVEQLRAWNEFAVLHRLHFLPVLLQDLVGYVGPMVAPGQAPCYECVISRQNAHLVDYRSRRAMEAAFLQDQAVGGFHPSIAAIPGDIAALELTKFFGLGGALARTGVLIEINVLGSEMKARRVLRLPRCPVCSRLNSVSSTAFTRSWFAGPDREKSR